MPFGGRAQFNLSEKVENDIIEFQSLIIKNPLEKYPLKKKFDYNIKDVVIKKGELIQPKHIMAFTTLGIKEIQVKKQIKIKTIEIPGSGKYSIQPISINDVSFDKRKSFFIRISIGIFK